MALYLKDQAGDQWAVESAALDMEDRAADFLMFLDRPLGRLPRGGRLLYESPPCIVAT